MNEQPPRITRRRAMQIALVGGLVAAGGSAVAIVGAFLRPSVRAEAGAPIRAGNVRDYQRGSAMRPTTFGFWVANLDPLDAQPNGPEGASGLLACWEKCPHLGSTVDWRPEFEYEGTKGWFRCRTHGGTFTSAGVRVFGPPPRLLDTMRVTVDNDGAVTVHTGDIRLGGSDNPKRAVEHPLLPS